MTVKIIPVETKAQDKEFINLPWKIYSKDPNWVPPLKMAVKELFKKKHPFYESAHLKRWLAIKDAEIVGRIAAIVNDAHNEFHNEKVGFFGFFESINDQEVADALLETAENYVKLEGMDTLRGPMNPSTNYECGLLVEGFDDPPQIMMTYNPSYYIDLLSNKGYAKAKDLLAYYMPTDIKMPPLIHRIAERMQKSSKITFRYLNKKNWDAETKLMREIYNDAWEKNWGFVPMSENEFYHMTQELKFVADERFVLFAEHEGKAIGFLVALPDYNQVFKHIPSGNLFPTGILKLFRAKKYINRLRVITLGVKHDYRHLGVPPLLYRQIQDEALKAGHYVEAEQSWILEDNVPMNKPLKIMGARPYKTYRIFERSLS